MPPTAAQRGQEAREKLLAAAVELIGELGWNGVSTRNLAERAGVRSGLVHYHFESLQVLLRQATMDVLHHSMDYVSQQFADSADPGEMITQMLTFLDDYTGRDPVSLLLSEANLAATRDEILRAEILTVVTRFRQRLTAALTAARVPDPEVTATAAMSLMDGFVMHKALDPQLSGAAVAPVALRLLTRKGDEL